MSSQEEDFLKLPRVHVRLRVRLRVRVCARVHQPRERAGGRLFKRHRTCECLRARVLLCAFANALVRLRVRVHWCGCFRLCVRVCTRLEAVIP